MIIAPHIVFWNANSLSHAKLDQLDAFLQTFPQCLFVGVCESKHPLSSLDPSHASRRCPHNFKAFRQPFNKPGSAGLAVFIHRSITARVRTDLSKSPHFIVVQCRIPGLSSPLLVGVCYRWHQSTVQEWSSSLQSIALASKANLPFILLGDFNAHHASFGDPKSDSFGDELLDTFDSSGLVALNPLLCPGKATRNTSVIDLAATNRPSIVKQMDISSALLSDHHCIALELANTKELEPTDHKSAWRWNLTTANWAKYEEELKPLAAACRQHLATLASDFSEGKPLISDPAVSSDLEQKIQNPPYSGPSESRCRLPLGPKPKSGKSASQNPSDRAHQSHSARAQLVADRMAALLEQSLLTAAERSISKRWSKPRTATHRHPSLHRSLRAYRQANKIYRRHQDQRSMQLLQQAKAEFVQQSQQRQNAIWEKRFQKLNDNGRVNWDALKAATKEETFAADSVSKSLDKLAGSTKEALDSLASYFADVCTLPEAKRPSEHELRIKAKLPEFAETASSEDAPFTSQEVKKACQKPKRAKAAAGPDGITATFLKHAPDSTFECLATILNFTWQYGVLPQAWRQADVCPLFKAAASDRGDPSNYRPISLTSIVCKTCERLVLARLWRLAGHRISKRQFGFKPKHSTLDGLIYLQHHIQTAFARSQHLPVAFLDISKAFDRTWHTGLLYKLGEIGITGRPWRWCQAFLSDRRLRTKQDGEYSDWFSFNAGVPQGSVLSPFLFLVFINDIQSVTQGLAIPAMFADDIALIPVHLGKAGGGALFKALKELDCWAAQWKVAFNAKKSKVMCFTNGRVVPKFNVLAFASGYLEQVKTFDYLGLRWQENGKWDAHVEKVSASARRVAGLITCIINRQCPPQLVVRQLVHALIRTKILYGMPVWKPGTSKQWRQLDKIVSDVFRNSLGLPDSAEVSSILVEMNTLSFTRQFDLQALSSCHRMQNLPADHESRNTLLAQLSSARRARNPSFPHHAQSKSAEYKAEQVFSKPADKLPKKVFTARALALQRIEWRKEKRTRLLNDLVPAGPNLPQYLSMDARPVAVIRARLRFDRSHLAESRKRRGEKTTGKCATCHKDDTLDHLLFECKLIGRAPLLQQAKAQGLPLDHQNMRLWQLGGVELIDDRKILQALLIGGKFLLAASLVRKL